MTDPYSVLGITPGADDETIKKAYRQKCKQYHPDLHPDDPAAEEHFKEVQAAYSAPAAQPGGKAMAAPPVTLNCGRRQIISAAAFMRRLSTH